MSILPSGIHFEYKICIQIYLFISVKLLYDSVYCSKHYTTLVSLRIYKLLNVPNKRISGALMHLNLVYLAHFANFWWHFLFYHKLPLAFHPVVQARLAYAVIIKEIITVIATLKPIWRSQTTYRNSTDFAV